MEQTLTHASRQLFSREDDEIYPDLDSLISFLRRREEHTQEIAVHDLLALPAEDDKLKLEVEGIETSLTDWSFGALCRLCEPTAPKNFVNKLPAEITTDILNYGLENRLGAGNNLRATMSNDTGSYVTRSFHTPTYSRLPDVECAERVRDIAVPLGYQPAGIFSGTRGGMAPIRPEATGLYASDRDVYMFMANEEGGFDIDGDEFFHLFILWSSECSGARKIGFLTTLYRFICGNHMIWGARDTIEMSKRHVGQGPWAVLDSMENVLQGYEKYRQLMVSHARTRILAARRLPFEKTREKVAERLENYMSRKEAAGVLPFLDDERAYPQSPESVYGVAQGVTLFSESQPYANRRQRLDEASGQIVMDSVGF